MSAQPTTKGLLPGRKLWQHRKTVHQIGARSRRERRDFAKTSLNEAAGSSTAMGIARGSSGCDRQSVEKCGCVSECSSGGEDGRCAPAVRASRSPGAQNEAAGDRQGGPLRERRRAAEHKGLGCRAPWPFCGDDGRPGSDHLARVAAMFSLGMRRPALQCGHRLTSRPVRRSRSSCQPSRSRPWRPRSSSSSSPVANSSRHRATDCFLTALARKP